jgi:hypothetical protein
MEIDELKENIRSHTQDNIEDQRRIEETNNNMSTSEEVQNQNSEEADQHKDGDRLKEGLEIIQMPERQRLPRNK